MSFSTDLLDGFDLLNKRTDGALKAFAEYSSFFKDFSKLQKDHAKSLMKLAASQKKEFEKAPPHLKDIGSTYVSWQSTLTELEKLADRHSQVADSIENDICKTIANTLKEWQKDRKKLESESRELTKGYKSSLDNLQKCRQKYVASSKEADDCKTAHGKAKDDASVKASQLTKIEAKASQFAQKAQKSEAEYQQMLGVTNQKQTDYYTNTMPALLQEYQRFEERRIAFVKEILQKFAACQADLPQTYTDASRMILDASNNINISDDIQAFCRENRTNSKVPGNIEFVNYLSDQPAPAKPIAKARPTLKASSIGKIGKYKGAQGTDLLASKKWGLQEEDHRKTIEEKQTILQTQLDELDKGIVQEGKTREGLENLVRFYASDPTAQKKAEEQLTECDRKLERYQETRGRVQEQLDNVLSGSSDSMQYDSLQNSGSGKMTRVRALYKYIATCDTELNFEENEELTVTDRDESGWWYAERDNGQAGFVPNNYLEIIEE